MRLKESLRYALFNPLAPIHEFIKPDHSAVVDSWRNCRTTTALGNLNLIFPCLVQDLHLLAKDRDHTAYRKKAPWLHMQTWRLKAAISQISFCGESHKGIICSFKTLRIRSDFVPTTVRPHG